MKSESAKKYERKGKPVDFVARIEYLTSEQGGRSTAAHSGYRPHLKLEGKSELTSAEQIFVGKGEVNPGESVTAEVRILWAEAFEGSMQAGMVFTLSEGPNLVANGIITEVLNERLKKTANKA